ncbi:MAG: dihydroorotase [Candidatus Omnitrophica bacterium]|nr:dihydroorotase [Candidatus Omnitrophota bacterium]MDD5592495.1 dihydroorotase [Candidatus Omnitrophota bacterium]
MKILIKNGQVIDPANNIDGICDILVEGAKISRVAKNIKADADNVIEARGKIVMPGIVDMHVHLREPGREDKETIATGTKAALKGGVTSLLAMPNTAPAMDCPENIRLLKNIIQRSGQANVFIAGAITKGRLGKELTDIASLKKEGVVAISDDGASVENAELMRQALLKAKDEGVLVISHCEDKSLSNSGVVNLGIISTRLGLRGMPAEAEYKRVERDIRLAEETKSRLHIAHVSTKESVQLIAAAKKKGINITAEVTPHHFSLVEEAVLGFDANMKMNPPLRSKSDTEALKECLKSGIIDAIASDHAPHTENEKEIEFQRAEFGTIGLETELAASITELVKTGLLGWIDLVKKLCLNPARILGIDKGTLDAGCGADIIIVSPDKEWIVTKEQFVSKSKNSAFLGKQLSGIVEYTICAGKIVYTNSL